MIKQQELMGLAPLQTELTDSYYIKLGQRQAASSSAEDDLQPRIPVMLASADGSPTLVAGAAESAEHEMVIEMCQVEIPVQSSRSHVEVF